MAGIITPLTGGPQLRPPEAITRLHDVSAFSSSSDELNYWLKHHALRNERRTSRTYVVTHGQSRVVGYHCLAAGGVAREELPRNMRRNTPEEIPVVVLGRLATDQSYERRGIGSGMLADAIRRTLNSAAEIGVRALIVHALDDNAIRFYLKYGFVMSPLNERTLILPVETARGALED